MSEYVGPVRRAFSPLLYTRVLLSAYSLPRPKGFMAIVLCTDLVQIPSVPTGLLPLTRLNNTCNPLNLWLTDWGSIQSLSLSAAFYVQFYILFLFTNRTNRNFTLNLYFLINLFHFFLNLKLQICRDMHLNIFSIVFSYLISIH